MEEIGLFCFYAKSGNLDNLIEYLDLNPDTGADIRHVGFVLAAQNGQYDVVNHLLDDPHIDPTAHDSLALRVAVKNNHILIVETLFEEGRIDADARNDQALVLACYNANRNMVRLLLRHASVHPTARNNLPMRLTHRLDTPTVRKVLVRKQAVKNYPNPSMEVTDGEYADLRLEAESVDHEVLELEEALHTEDEPMTNAESNGIPNTNTNTEDPLIRIANANAINRYMPNEMRNNVLTSNPIKEGNAMVQLNNHVDHVFTQPSIQKWWRTQRKKRQPITNPLTRNPIANIRQVKRFTAKWLPSV